jgi:hypothetical protein
MYIYDRFLLSLIKVYYSLIADKEYIRIVMKIASYVKLILHWLIIIICSVVKY